MRNDTERKALKYFRVYLLCSYLVVPASLVLYINIDELVPQLENLLLGILIGFTLIHPAWAIAIKYLKDKHLGLTWLYFLLYIAWAYTVSILLLIYTLDIMY